MRGRGGNNRKGPNPLTRSYESNGPDVKIRGTAQQIADKYTALARDAQSSGDRVMAENYLQHAEHYNRIIAAAQAALQNQQQQQQGVRDVREDFEEDTEDSFELQGSDRQRIVNDGTGPQPTFDGPPAEAALKEQREEAVGNGRHIEQANGAASPQAAEAVPNGGAPEDDGEAAPKRPRRTRRTARSRGSENGQAGEASPSEAESTAETAASDSAAETAAQG
jgi:hypothetical protein